jgi:hypothetical protein
MKPNFSSSTRRGRFSSLWSVVTAGLLLWMSVPVAGAQTSTDVDTETTDVAIVETVEPIEVEESITPNTRPLFEAAGFSFVDEACGPSHESRTDWFELAPSTPQTLTVEAAEAVTMTNLVALIADEQGERITSGIELDLSPDDGSEPITLNEANGFYTELAVGNYTWSWRATNTKSNVPDALNVAFFQGDSAINTSGRACYIDAYTDIDETDLSNLVGKNAFIVGNETALNHWNVFYYEDDRPGYYKRYSDQRSFVYLNDTLGISQRPQCLSSAYAPSEQVGPMAIQWLCVEGETPYYWTFISPDFFALLSNEQQDILSKLLRSQSPQSVISEEVNEDETGTVGVVLAFLVAIATLLGAIWMLGMPMVQWLKAHRHRLLGLGLTVWILIGLGVGVYIGVSATGWPDWLESYLWAFAIITALFLFSLATSASRQTTGLRAPAQKSLGHWGRRIFWVSGVVWLYAFFLTPQWQSLPLLGVMGGVTLLALAGQAGRHCDEGWVNQHRDHFKKVLIALPVIVLGYHLILLGVGPNEVTWQASQFGTEQDLRLLDEEGQPLSSSYLESSQSIWVDGTFSIATDTPNSFLGAGGRWVTLSMAVDSQSPLVVTPKHAITTEGTNRSIFYVPNAESLSLVYENEQAVGLYRFPQSKVLSAKAAENIEDILESAASEDDEMIVTNLSESLVLHSPLKETLGKDFPTEVSADTTDEETITVSASTTTLPLNTWAIGPIEFYVEVLDDTLEMNLELTQIPDVAAGTQRFSLVIFNADDEIINLYNQELNFSFGQNEQTQSIEITEPNLEAGVYKIRFEPAGGLYQFIQDSPAAYQLDQLTVNSPTIVASAKNWITASATEWTVYNVNEETVMQSLDDSGAMSVLGTGLKAVTLEKNTWLNSTVPLLIAADESQWVFPFDYWVLNYPVAATQYLVVETAFVDEIQEEEGTYWYQQTWKLPLDVSEWVWTVSSLDPNTDWAATLKSITLTYL